MEEWVKAVNNHGGFGEWAFAVSRDPGDVEGIIARYSNPGAVESPEPEEMNDDLKVLKQFLEIPIGSSDGVFERFKQIPNADFRGEKQERFLYVRGCRQNKVLLVAHADTVWDKHYKEPFTSKHEVIFHNGIVKSGNKGCGIGADDRAGCAILWLLKDMGHSLLITDGEEHGKFGSSWLMSHNRDIADEINNEHQFVIQFDRCNGQEYKCYNVGTDEFRSYVKKKTGYGEPDLERSTDICLLCETVTGVNLSIGYHHEHHSNEYLDLREWENTLNVCRTWLAEKELPKFRRS
jgi:hypothetical protein